MGMAYRRRQGISKQTTFEQIYHNDHHHNDNDHDVAKKVDSYLSSTSSITPPPASSSLAAQAIKASAAHRESSLSSAYDRNNNNRSKVFGSYEETGDRNDSRGGFWGILAQKAKAILEDDAVAQQFETPARSRWQMPDIPTGGQPQYQSLDSRRKLDNPTLRKSLDAITSSLNQIGDSFEKAFEEGRTIVGNKTADIIQETRKLQIRRKGTTEGQYPVSVADGSWQESSMQQPPVLNQTNPETQLKASREVAMATAAKAKLLLRELKTVKADLAFAKQRCAQLEEENKLLRENREKGANAADDDLIRLQLETLLAEKARLANENEVYARENRFLREIVEYHQLTMQDVVYIDDGIEEVTEVSPIPSVSGVISISPPSPRSPQSPEVLSSTSSFVEKETSPPPEEPQGKEEVEGSMVATNSNTSDAEAAKDNDGTNLPTSPVQ